MDKEESSLSGQDFAHLLQTINRTYGDRGERILNRIGKAPFHIVLRDQGVWVNAARPLMSLWPSRQRIQFILESLASTHRKIYPDSEILLEDKNGTLTYIEQDCHECQRLQSSQPICYLNTGFIREAVQWATGEDFEVLETDCLIPVSLFADLQLRR